MIRRRDGDEEDLRILLYIDLHLIGNAAHTCCMIDHIVKMM